MSCEPFRAAIQAASQGDWPPGVAAHLATCDACMDVAIERALRQRPASVPPPAFAADVARRARVEPPPRPERLRGLAAGMLAGVASAAAPAVWLAASAIPRVSPPQPSFWCSPRASRSSR